MKHRLRKNKIKRAAYHKTVENLKDVMGEEEMYSFMTSPDKGYYELGSPPSNAVLEIMQSMIYAVPKWKRM